MAKILQVSSKTPLPDPSGFQLTPTLHAAPYDSIHPTNNTLRKPFTVVVLGASKGIGFHIAKAYAIAEATTIFLVSRSLSSLESAAGELRSINNSSVFHLVEANTSSSTEMARLRDSVIEKSPSGRLDVVIVNAAYYGPMTTSVLSGDPNDFAQVMSTNVLGAYHAAHYLIPLLLSTKNGAKNFFTISSLGAWMVQGEVAHTAACVSKLTQARLVEMISHEFKEQGLLATAIHPGFVATDMSSVVDKEWRKHLTDDPLLCGSFCVWLSNNSEELQWLSGRFLNAKWDAMELSDMRESITGKDMLVARMVVS
ncbi:NAD(P)-binding protein [Periconia macrospinosa]|uniref:NAD(P)-binding protein n=1 Tax=Periconia macrospinosa TaxID=97972 RepID=A0A2V1DJF6_9PLEO|nr:NAD(P)-binding protein [Periconia macrospinosa]